MKSFIICLLLFGSSINCYAWTEDMKCNTGNCDQWEATYERSGDWIKIHFENISGKPLFKIKATIRYFDYMGEYLGQHFVKLEGPIVKYFDPVFKVTSNTSRVEYDINCLEDYEGVPLPVKGE